MKKILILLLLFFTPIARADLLGVMDTAVVAEIAKQIYEIKKQYDVLKKTYDNAKSQLENAKLQLNSLKELKNFNTGHYGLGEIVDKFENLKNKKWGPSDWESALIDIAGGNPEQLKKYVKAYENSHKYLSDEEFLQGSSKELLDLYKKNIQVNKAVQIQSTYIFDDLDRHQKLLQELQSKIEQTPNTKAALDLNSGILIELAYIEMENLKMQSLIGQQMAQSAANDIETQTQITQFNRPNKEE